MLNFDPLAFGGEEAARAYLKHCHDLLAEGGELMPLGEYPFSKYYAWVRDRYGFTWQLMLTDPAGEPAPFFIPALMFGGPNLGNCLPATEAYISLFDGHRPLLRVYEEDGMLEKGSVEFTNFVLGGRWFAAMDSGAFHDFTFSLGVSLILSVPDQTLIDHHWAELSAYPEAERCGWCKDRWGVSWQILPDNLGSLLQDEGFRSAFMSMGKILIDTRTE